MTELEALAVEVDNLRFELEDTKARQQAQIHRLFRALTRLTEDPAMPFNSAAFARAELKKPLYEFGLR